ncbi:MAG: peptidoglycan editing factor PgeF [Proteobacteria bacterium]|nr:peptidoglycan editing factor PgeF [Pseudomonadota bacterium]MBW3616235.1 peptidoglycan editing factor PgeF [Pseudomonadota bacterium]
MSLPVLTSPLLDALPGVRHAFFTREGGVSTGVYASLNLGRGSRDDPAAVAENRRRAAAHLAVEEPALLACYQVHSAEAVQADRAWGEARPEADAVVTGAPGLACGALSADCAPILMVDPQAGVVGAAHAGWKGALSGVVLSAVNAMTRLGADTDRIVAVVGPCIGPDSYEVGPEFHARFQAEIPLAGRFFRPARSPDKRLFDLPAFVLQRLAEAGVARAEWIGADTLTDERRFFSNRRAVQRGDPDYGRLMSAIVLTS